MACRKTANDCVLGTGKVCQTKSHSSLKTFWRGGVSWHGAAKPTAFHRNKICPLEAADLNPDKFSFGITDFQPGKDITFEVFLISFVYFTDSQRNFLESY